MPLAKLIVALIFGSSTSTVFGHFTSWQLAADEASFVPMHPDPRTLEFTELIGHTCLTIDKDRT